MRPLNRETAALFAVLPLIGGLIHWGIRTAAYQQGMQKQERAQREIERRRSIAKGVQEGIQRHEARNAETPAGREWSDRRDGSAISAQFAAYRSVLNNFASLDPDFTPRLRDIVISPPPPGAVTPLSSPARPGPTWTLKGTVVFKVNPPGGPQRVDWKTEQCWDARHREWTVVKTSLWYLGPEKTDPRRG